MQKTELIRVCRRRESKALPTPPTSKKGLAQSGYAELCAITCQICKHYPPKSRGDGGDEKIGILPVIPQNGAAGLFHTSILACSFHSSSLHVFSLNSCSCTFNCSLRDIYQRLFLARLFPSRLYQGTARSFSAHSFRKFELVIVQKGESKAHPSHLKKRPCSIRV